MGTTHIELICAALCPVVFSHQSANRVCDQCICNRRKRTEGLLLDPVYTGKSFAGLLDLLKTNQIRSGMRVLFIHTGGLPALYAYQKEIDAI